MKYPTKQDINGRTLYREPTPPTLQELKDAIETADYKYFGYYEFDTTQFAAVETLVQFALHHIYNEENQTRNP